MSLTFDWFLPTTGDSRALVGGGHSVPTDLGREGGPLDTAGRFREPDLKYLVQVARTAEDLGFDAVLTPTGTPCEDAWVVASALIPETERLKFLIALRPGLISPTLLAQMASTFQRLSGDRLLLNVVVGGDPSEQLRFGDRVQKDDRYARAAEFLQVFRGAFTEAGSTFRGEHYDVQDARTRRPARVPQIYLGGSSAAAGPVTAAHTDVYLTWGEPPGAVADKIAWIRKLADEQGRTVRFGVRLHTISRDHSQDAWQIADRMLAGLDPAQVAQAQEALAASESEGQKRMRELHGGAFDRADARSLEVHPGLWAGVGLMRSGAGTALVGSHTEVADLIGEYAEIGIDEFVMSGYPHVEEAYWFAEGVLPILRKRDVIPGVASAPRPG
ncbi:LLM class flavin-dependent oxidoreductase [Aeromicrobium wangtongii]|uniref:LLM class flavin-dependent oxidoreductase n=1 Tax=Aeromicrobium wangtongii TaxID=2969247 RepID=A0ABY5M7S8_9ACTN|nr:LLM class flavin-dependent oxidoreductase [Aeromicrobium wangtongii]UUP14213.1 LLM class flavin-dependent oxidoreductase [Aeromicrobium wangtongii]